MAGSQRECGPWLLIALKSIVCDIIHCENNAVAWRISSVGWTRIIKPQKEYSW
jgi:hypothetical protein